MATAITSYTTITNITENKKRCANSQLNQIKKTPNQLLEAQKQTNIQRTEKTQLRLRPDKADVNAKATMHGRAIDAEEDPVSHRSPSWVLGITIEAHLKNSQQNTQTNRQKYSKPINPLRNSQI